MSATDPTDGCDLNPFAPNFQPGSVAVTFDFDLSLEIAFVRGGATLWSNEGAPDRLSDLIRDHAAPELLQAMALQLALALLRVKAAAELAAT